VEPGGKHAELASLRAIGVLRSRYKTRAEAPRQGSEDGADAWLELKAFARPAIEGLASGDVVVVVTWLHRARRDVLKVHPRRDQTTALAGVFATRSPDRPNPLGLHRVIIREVAERGLLVGPIETIDRTPVVDIKPVLRRVRDF
jgi:tRNA-Thr(GGU) m(6)t(6)A37 methyltransferase TsaA